MTHSTIAEEGESFQFNPKIISDDYYVYKGDFESTVTLKKKEASGTYDRELGLKGSDIRAIKESETLLKFLSPTRAAVLAILRIPKGDYVIGELKKQKFQWGNEIFFKHEYSIQGLDRTEGVNFQKIVGTFDVLKHVAIAKRFQIKYEAYYNEATRKIEIIDLQLDGLLKYVPLWFRDHPPFWGNYYGMKSKARVTLIHLKQREGMPKCYTDDAVEQGVQRLLSTQQKRTGWLGGQPANSLAMTALLAAGVQANHPILQNSLKVVLKQPYNPGSDVYDHSPYARSVLCLFAEYNKEWLTNNLTKKDFQKIKTVVVENCQKLEQIFNKTGRGWGDMSRTQYAVLGLYSAAATGWYNPKTSFLLDILDLHLKLQEKTGPEVEVLDRFRIKSKEKEKENNKAKDKSGKDIVPTSVAITPESEFEDEKIKAHVRGWGYSNENEQYGKPTGSITCGAIASLLFLKRMLIENNALNYKTRKKIDKAILDGRAWMQKYYSVANTPMDKNNKEWKEYDSLLFMYYMYSLERACVMNNWEFIGEHNWYEEGSLHLMKIQTDEGFWKTGDRSWVSEEIELAWALLFFKRGTLKLHTESIGNPDRVVSGDD